MGETRDETRPRGRSVQVTVRGDDLESLELAALDEARRSLRPGRSARSRPGLLSEPQGHSAGGCYVAIITVREVLDA